MLVLVLVLATAGLSLMVSMVTLERHNGFPTLERGNDQRILSPVLEKIRPYFEYLAPRC